MQQWKRLVPVLMLVVLAAAGCGTDDDGPDVATAGGNVVPTASATTDADGTAQMLVFTQCMRDNGVAINDPDPGAGLDGLARVTEGIDTDDPVFQQAYEVCRANLPNGGEGPTLNPEQAQRYLAFARCLRDNGIEGIPDPGPDGTIQLDSSMLGLLQDPALQPALEACRDTLTGLITAMGATGTTE